MTTPQMGRPFNFPNPRNVTVGNPTFLASRDLVVSLYNQANPATTTQKYCQRTKDWFITEALNVGWSIALETGNSLGILLHLRVSVPKFAPQGQLPPGE